MLAELYTSSRSLHFIFQSMHRVCFAFAVESKSCVRRGDEAGRCGHDHEVKQERVDEQVSGFKNNKAIANQRCCCSNLRPRRGKPCMFEVQSGTTTDSREWSCKYGTNEWATATAMSPVRCGYRAGMYHDTPTTPSRHSPAMILSARSLRAQLMHPSRRPRRYPVDRAMCPRRPS